MEREINIGRIFSHASWILPTLGLFSLMAFAACGMGSSVPLKVLCLSLVAPGACCGIIALIGMFRWGSRDWAFVISGLAISIFLRLMA